MRYFPVTFLLLFPAVAAAQESVRDLDRPGEHHKHLTRDTVDHWKIVAEAGEVLRVDVSSREFDPVLELVTAEGDAVVPPVDDPGSASRFLVRIENAGKYEILVHGPEHRGGGNYRLHVERFASRPIGADRTLESTLGRDGKGHVRFEANAGELIVPVGAPIAEVIDPKGLGLAEWGGSYTITRSGEHYIRLRGRRGQLYRLRVVTGRQRTLATEEIATGVEREEELDGRGMDVWSFDAAAGDFRAVKLEQRRPCHLRVVRVDEEDEAATRLETGPDLQLVPVHSKGNRQRLAFIVGRAGRYQVQILSAVTGSNGYHLTFGDPSRFAPLGSPIAGRLPVGDSAFYTFAAAPGQLVQIDVTSDDFDPLLSVKRPDGTDIGHNDDGGTDLSSRFTFLAKDEREFRLHVTCYGNGGGGDYELAVRELEIPDLTVGESREHSMAGPGTAYWHFTGQRDQLVFVSARSATMDMAVRVHGPSGIDLGGDDDSGVENDALLALRLPADGRYTLVARNKSGSGSCRVQVIDPAAG